MEAKVTTAVQIDGINESLNGEQETVRVLHERFASMLKTAASHGFEVGSPSPSYSEKQLGPVISQRGTEGWLFNVFARNTSHRKDAKLFGFAGVSDGSKPRGMSFRYQTDGSVGSVNIDLDQGFLAGDSTLARSLREQLPEGLREVHIHDVDLSQLVKDPSGKIIADALLSEAEKGMKALTGEISA